MFIILVAEIKDFVETIVHRKTGTHNQSFVHLEAVARRKMEQLGKSAEIPMGVFMRQLIFSSARVAASGLVGPLVRLFVRILDVSQGSAESSFEHVVLSTGQEVEIERHSDSLLTIVILRQAFVVCVAHAYPIAPMGFGSDAAIERNTEALECRFPPHRNGRTLRSQLGDAQQQETQQSDFSHKIDALIM